jgi:D-amino peptidase
VAGDLAACRLELPTSFDVSVRYKDHRTAFRKSFYPGARLEEADTLYYSSDDWYEVLRCLSFVI